MVSIYQHTLLYYFHTSMKIEFVVSLACSTGSLKVKESLQGATLTFFQWRVEWRVSLGPRLQEKLCVLLKRIVKIVKAPLSMTTNKPSFLSIFDLPAVITLFVLAAAGLLSRLNANSIHTDILQCSLSWDTSSLLLHALQLAWYPHLLKMISWWPKMMLIQLHMWRVVHNSSIHRSRQFASEYRAYCPQSELNLFSAEIITLNPGAAASAPLTHIYWREVWPGWVIQAWGWEHAR